MVQSNQTARVVSDEFCRQTPSSFHLGHTQSNSSNLRECTGVLLLDSPPFFFSVQNKEVLDLKIEINGLGYMKGRLSL